MLSRLQRVPSGRRNVAHATVVLGSIRPTSTPRSEVQVQLFTIFFSRPIEFGIATGITVLMLVIIVRAALSAQGPSGLGRFMSRPTTKVLFGLLFLGWAIVFGIGLQLVPHEGANSPYGGLGLIMMFTGFFIMMGFIWSVIGE